MATRVSYPLEVEMKAIEMRLAGTPVREVMEKLCIRNKTQLKTWMCWHRSVEMHRQEQPAGKEYSYGKGLKYGSELEKLQGGKPLPQAVDRIAKKVQGDGKEVSSASSTHGWSRSESCYLLSLKSSV
ncbi:MULTISPECIES: hypothetical protein [Paenibacillus]|uniref:hypothetical protein n=1 Tax=Paenibacillus TaxID=44249 RepID=UPI000CDA85CD|nr:MULTISPECIES: hypothetical protein [Paenibacillus]POR28612.1 hypothetical protein CG775_08565 [Paenibacillus polymyxa]